MALVGFVQRHAIGRQAEVAARMVHRVGHQPQMCQPAAGRKAVHAGLGEGETGHVHIAGKHPEHIVQLGQGTRNAACRFQRIAEVLAFVRERDVGTLGMGFLPSMDLAIGQKLVRPAVVDQVLSPTFMEQPAMVRKGDHVVIVARSPSLAVRMPGEALSDGGLNEQIRVRNLNSKRVMKANVTGPGQVEVAM